MATSGGSDGVTRDASIVHVFDRCITVPSRSDTGQPPLSPRFSRRPSSARPINLTTMPDGKNQHEQHCVGDLVDDPVVPGAHSPSPVATDKLACRRGMRILREQGKHTINALADWINALADWRI